jgi:Abortive infection alpha
MIAAADESRDELQDIWAALLAAAANPAKSKGFRVKFIEIVRKMDPLDAAVLKAGAAIHAKEGGNFTSIDGVAKATRVTIDEARVSAANLESLDLAIRPDGGAKEDWFRPTPLGRELIRAIE